MQESSYPIPPDAGKLVSPAIEQCRRQSTINADRKLLANLREQLREIEQSIVRVAARIKENENLSSGVG